MPGCLEGQHHGVYRHRLLVVQGVDGSLCVGLVFKEHETAALADSRGSVHEQRDFGDLQSQSRRFSDEMIPLAYYQSDH